MTHSASQTDRAPRPLNGSTVVSPTKFPKDCASTSALDNWFRVPFGARRLQGVVVALSETTDLAETRQLESIVYLEPLLTVRQIDLAYWMSRRYLAPLADCIWLFLPPGIEDKVETLIELVPEADTTALTDNRVPSWIKSARRVHSKRRSYR